MSFFDQIAGTWHLERAIIDRRAGLTARFRGLLEAAPMRRGLILAEQGQWVEAPWGDLTARRADLWEIRGGLVHVFYEDGRPFHQFDPSGGACHHLCGCDDYHGQYAFDLPTAWQLDWQVTGPRKDYQMTTRYVR